MISSFMEINISSNSVGSKSPGHDHVSSQQASPEESTWTMYFEEYFGHKNDIVHDHDHDHLHDPNFSFASHGVDHASSSVVSDAASSAAGKSSAAAGVLSRKRLGLIKKRNKSNYSDESGFMVEDDLQDTACSPKRNRGSRLKGKREIMGSMEGRDTTDLNTSKQKKGFCLVPLSMELNYLQ